VRRKTWALASASLLLAVGALGQEINPPHDLPPEIRGDFGANDTPQSATDLRRSRDLAYGRTLTAPQHDEILSWRTESPSWWLAPERAAIADARNSELEALIRDTPEGVLKQSFDQADVTFGIRMITEDSTSFGSGEPSPPTETITVVVEVDKRPDLFPLSEVLLDFAMEYVAAENADKKGLFAQILHRALACDGAGGAESGCGLYDSSELLTLQTELEDAFDRELLTLAEERGAIFATRVHPIRETYAGDNSSLLTQSILQQMFDQASAETRHAAETAASRLIAEVPDLLRDGLLDLVTERHRSSTITRVYLTESGAAAFLESLRNGLAAAGSSTQGEF